LNSGKHEQDLLPDLWSNRKSMQFISCTSWKCETREKCRQWAYLPSSVLVGRWL